MLAKQFDGSRELAETGRLAWVLAIDENDTALTDTLLANGYPADRVVSQNLTPLTYALSQGAAEVAHRLVDSGASIGDGVVIFLRDIDMALVDKLIAVDVAFDVEAVGSAATSGQLDVAVAVARTARQAGEWGDVENMLISRANRERDTADKIEARQMGSYATPEKHREMALSLETVVDRLRSIS